MRKHRVAVDVGGTFTDVCVFDTDTASTTVAKVSSTPDNPMRAVLEGIRAANVDLSQVALFSHGTTVATNALITRRFPKAAMVTTRGFRDVLEIRNGTKSDLWDAYKDVGPPYIRRRDRYEVTERVNYVGDVVTPLDENEARQVARVLRRKGVETVAIGFINSYANAGHEQRMKEILAEELPGVSVSTSSEILPEIFEYDRFSTTVANTVLGPLVSGYVNELEGELSGGGYDGDLLLLHSGGGSMTPTMAQRYPVRLAASGIAAGAIAVRDLAERCGYGNAIGLDMGGTSTDISLVHNNEIRRTKEWHVEYGFPICFPSIEVLTIGAGGGSLAWLDEAGSLRNGPASAGADPGPACYQLGGKEPTNTDASLVLDRLGTELVGGAMSLDRTAAENAIAGQIAEPLGLELDEAASDVLQVANANMADAVRLISIRRGYDPRDFALVVFGGAGGLHGAALAKELSIPVVVVPRHPGITSAQGCLLVDIRHDLTTMFQAESSTAEVDELESEFGKLESDATERLRREGASESDMLLERSISMRYSGQWRSLTVPISSGPEALAEAVEQFHEQHEREYSFRRDDTPVELYQLLLRATGTTPKPSFPRRDKVEQDPPEPIAHRRTYFEECEGRVDTPVYDREQLVAGTRIPGPAVVEQLDSTTVIPPGTPAVIDEWLNIRIHVSEASR
ncbi:MULTISPECIES: hydantoinase/oxoprolinase family protein [Prauserella salsuginis group]|uniref:Hydantoinase/oxoprolinase family protein n=1 Tax=Prauserella salsuginis TaxID=387889 RepID=A0ABW6G0N4_9PSEU|nr:MULTISPECIES: hydantoinase/oxoprolinase family protein [Prauserella salsuginis group]MCR3721927.1 N-methylhydantoinase A [Prauserella flava]MCR3735933.1 N-methylhydantoinase A [Prauserella salsuginis]